MEIFVPQPLIELTQKLNQPVYIVGGYVRNQICGLPLKSDIDICGAFDSSEFIKTGAKATPINKSLGTAQVKYNGAEFEYTRFRSEKYDGTGNHSPINVRFINGIETDAKRRDFTANSIYYDVLNGGIVDPLNGLEDTKNKVLRAYDPTQVFTNDGLRLMRLARFAAELRFKIENQTLKAAKGFRDNLKDIAPERKQDELNKILYADFKYGIKYAHYKGLKYLTRLKLWQHILPSMTLMKIPQNPKYHNYNVLEHTFLAVKYAPPEVRLAALMHDTGKPVCKARDDNMHRHAEESALITEKELGQSGLKYPNKVVEEAARLCRLHMYDLNQKASDSKMRLFVAKNYDIIDKLQALAVADGKATGQKNLYTPRFLFFKEQLLEGGAPINLSDLKINGLDAVNAGYKNTAISKILEELWEECILTPKLNNKEWLLEQLEKRINTINE